jgi:hypothetical protein
MLRPPSGCSCLMIKTPLKLMRKSIVTPTFFMLLILVNYFILLFIILPCKLYSQLTLLIDFTNQVWFIINTILFALTLFFFVLSAFADPGYLKKPKDLQFLVSDFNTNRYRHYCKTLTQCCYVLTVK